jgi:hypothetical protein
MTTKRYNSDPSDRWSEADWSREFDAHETKARETTDLDRSRHRSRDSGSGLDPDDSWSDVDYVRWAKEHPGQASDWLEIKAINDTLDRNRAELSVKRAEIGSESEMRRSLRDLQHDTALQTAIARLELKAAEARRTLGDDEIKRRSTASRAAWREECAALKLYHIEQKAARANHTNPPPHPLYNKAAWQKWLETKSVQRYTGATGNGGVIADMLRSQAATDQRQQAREQRKRQRD